MAIKTMEITCVCLPADHIFYFPAFDDPIVASRIADAVEAAGDWWV
jgi:hypothetical protein